MLTIELATACSSYRPPPPPPPPPPPHSPIVPPAPPPINKVIRQQVQAMTRNNCKQVQVSAQNHAALMTANTEAVQAAQKQLDVNECLNAENYAYSCSFTVYSEIALTTIYHPTGCGCAFTIQVVKPRPALPSIANVLNVNAAYNTTVTRFSIIVYDIVADIVAAEVPQFSNMALDAATTAAIAHQVQADPNGDFTSITAGFAGTIQQLATLPQQLDYNDPANANYVPAISFTINQQYSTGAMFKVPCSIDLSTAPNAYYSQCQPFRASAPFTYSKRASLETEQAITPDTAWFREFYLFPKLSTTCGSSGYSPQSRYITSFYDSLDCKVSSGYLSFDREFTSKLVASNAVVGGWAWTRTFSDPRIVFGVPQVFSSLQQTWCLGYSQINWVSPSGFLPSTEAVSVGICKAFPATGFTSTVQSNKYGETQPSYSATATGVDCSPAFTPCNSDATLLAFQNRDPRDFSKNPTSTLLTGPRRNFCQIQTQDTAAMVVFDTLIFTGVPAGTVLMKKRGLGNFDDNEHKTPHSINLVYHPELDGLVHARHAPLVTAAVNKLLRKRGEQPIQQDPVSGAPSRDNFANNIAAGSVDSKGSDGSSAGDHPLRRFPETFSTPLTLDPVQASSDQEPLVYDGQLVTGVVPKFCDLGEIGCGCRGSSAISECDAPLTCNSLGYCVAPACPAGNAGCPAQSDGTCNDPALTATGGYCEYKSTCTAGTLGCTCSDSSPCTATNAQCLDGQCITSKTGVCAGGEAGCPCGSDGSCTGGTTCDHLSGMCLFQACTPGDAGCVCSAATGGLPCAAGFTCTGNVCLQTSCQAGTPGCSCLAGRQCGVQGYTCVDLTRDGAVNACVGEQLCPGGQEQRCLNECGPGNIAVCGECIYSEPICRDPTVQYCNSKSYL